MNRDLIIFIDSGDTLIDESTEILNENNDVIHADMIEGARDMLMGLYESGYRIALVADGSSASFRNVYREHSLEYIFEEWIISEELGVAKPDALMFRTAMERMGLTQSDKKRIVMIGNNLKRDILGANREGITSILESYSPRYSMKPETDDEIPDYVVTTPMEIPKLLEQLDLQVRNRRILEKDNPQG